ncbi:MAG TPA: alkaline phosphatase [Bacteroidales bacterium]|jgi:alkaline phosphatase|nr:alkaline phosphatase [Bacteroidales bacterium]
MKSVITFILASVFCISIHAQAQKPKYIFLCIGDGMGLVQAQLADAYLREQAKDSIPFLYFPYNGLQTTYSLSSKITCSAAAGTALACGVKTKANHIAVDETGVTKLESIAKTLKQRGYKIGIITSVSIDHATPAVFYAHDASRNSYHNIAMQLPVSNFDFFGGGAFVKPVDGKQNAYAELKKYKYSLITSPDSLQYASQLGTKVCVFDKKTELAYGIDNMPHRITLAQLMSTAIECVQSPQGFFIMAEGGKIDWACHSNDAATAVKETIEFSKAVQQAMAWYRKYPNETLIIVTADHETGGMGVGAALYPYYTNISLLANQTYSYVECEAALSAKIKALGSQFTFDSCMAFVTKAYAIGTNNLYLQAYDSVRLQRAYNFVFQSNADASGDGTLLYNISPKALYSSGNKASAIVITMNKIIAEKAGIGWTTYAHTGAMVPVYAIGAGSELFQGLYDNTDIPKKILSLLEITK